MDCGVCEVGIGDHALVYGLLKERNGFYESKVLTVKSYKELNEQQLRMDLYIAPWHVSIPSSIQSTTNIHIGTPSRLALLMIMPR